MIFDSTASRFSPFCMRLPLGAARDFSVPSIRDENHIRERRDRCDAAQIAFQPALPFGRNSLPAVWRYQLELPQTGDFVPGHFARLSLMPGCGRSEVDDVDSSPGFHRSLPAYTQAFISTDSQHPHDIRR